MIVALALLALVFFGFVCFYIYRNETNEVFKIIVFPVFILFGTILGIHYISELGRPLNQLPDGEWAYVHHEADGVTIELWLIDDDGSRLYNFPYTDERKDKLEEAQHKKQKGHNVLGEFEETRDGNSERNDGDKLSIRIDTKVTPK